MTLSPKATARSASGRRGSPRRAAGLVLAALFALTGAGLFWTAVTAPPEMARPPAPAPAAAPQFLRTPAPAVPGPSPDGSHAPATPAPTPDAADPVTLAGMTRATPTRIRIPGIGVDADVVPVGLDDNDQVIVPPLEELNLSGWYQLGPSPGEVGNAVIVGHVDSLAGPSVFFDLGAVQPGDTIEVVRADGAPATFTVDGVASYPKARFPTELVYGPTDQAQLRLITCGRYDVRRRDYLDNVIVFATLDPTEASRPG